MRQRNVVTSIFREPRRVEKFCRFFKADLLRHFAQNLTRLAPTKVPHSSFGRILASHAVGRLMVQIGEYEFGNLVG